MKHLSTRQATLTLHISDTSCSEHASSPELVAQAKYIAAKEESRKWKSLIPKGRELGMFDSDLSSVSSAKSYLYVNLCVYVCVGVE